MKFCRGRWTIVCEGLRNNSVWNEIVVVQQAYSFSHKICANQKKKKPKKMHYASKNKTHTHTHTHTKEIPRPFTGSLRFPLCQVRVKFSVSCDATRIRLEDDRNTMSFSGPDDFTHSQIAIIFLTRQPTNHLGFLFCLFTASENTRGRGNGGRRFSEETSRWEKSLDHRSTKNFRARARKSTNVT